MTAVTARQTAAPADAKLIRFALQQDALGSGANGLVYLAAAAIWGEMFGAPAKFLVPIGLFLIAFAAALMVLAKQPTVNKYAVEAVLAVNVLWVLGSIELLVADVFPLTGLGTALVIAQAVVVTAFTGLQIAGLRKL